MDRARSRKRSRAESYFVPTLVLLALSLPAGAASAADVAIVPSKDGHLGAWLALGPASSSSKTSKATKPHDHDMDTTIVPGESSLSGRLGRGVTLAALDPDGETSSAAWKIVSSA